MNILQALKRANQELYDASPSAKLDAQVLLTHVLQCNTAHLVAWPEKILSDTQLTEFQNLTQLRKNGSPVAHLTGQREFWSLNFFVDNSTLIPRPETETLIEFVLEKFGDKKNLKLLDMGTGTGAIAITLASEKPGWTVYASDISPLALQLATKNSVLHKTENIIFIQSDWFENIDMESFDIIISNPPYIADDDPHLLEGDVRFEPKSALVSGRTGMDAIKRLCTDANKFLVNDGWLIIEHGYNQKQAVFDCFVEHDFTQIEQALDLSGQPRMTAGKL